MIKDHHAGPEIMVAIQVDQRNFKRYWWKKAVAINQLPLPMS